MVLSPRLCCFVRARSETTALLSGGWMASSGTCVFAGKSHKTSDPPGNPFSLSVSKPHGSSPYAEPVPGVTYPRPRSRPRPPDDGSTSLPALFHLVPLRSHLCRVATLSLVRAARRSGVLATSWVHRWIPGSELCPDSRLPSPSPSHLCSPCYACSAVLPTPRSSASPSAW